MKTFSVTSVQTYTNPTADPAFCMDVHLQADDGQRATLIGLPGLCDPAGLEAFKLKRFNIGEAAAKPPKPAPKKKPK